MLRDTVLSLAAALASVMLRPAPQSAIALPPPANDDPAPLASPKWQHSAVDDDGNLIWPANPDEVPAWRLEREEWARRAGVQLPSYRTKREMYQGEERIRERLSGLVCREPSPALSPDDAAARFLNWLRSSGSDLEFSAQELSNAYDAHCADQNITPTSVDMMKAALALLPGVHRETVDMRVDGRRRRCAKWVITFEQDIPFDGEPEEEADEPLRVAA